MIATNRILLSSTVFFLHKIRYIFNFFKLFFNIEISSATSLFQIEIMNLLLKYRKKSNLNKYVGVCRLNIYKDLTIFLLNNKNFVKRKSNILLNKIEFPCFCDIYY